MASNQHSPKIYSSPVNLKIWRDEEFWVFEISSQEKPLIPAKIADDLARRILAGEADRSVRTFAEGIEVCAAYIEQCTTRPNGPLRDLPRLLRALKPQEIPVAENGEKVAD